LYVENPLLFLFVIFFFFRFFFFLDESPEFKQAVISLANIVGVVVHPDLKQTLKVSNFEIF